MIREGSKLNIVDEFRWKVYEMVNKPTSEVFSTFTNSYKNRDVLAYINYIYQQIERKSPNTILYAGNNTIESIIITFFLIISKYKVFILPEDFKKGSKLYDEVLKINDSFLYLCHGSVDKSFATQSHISAISLDQFIKDVHPTASINNFLEDFFNHLDKRQEKIFSSSGSTGTPKLIPLSLDNINACFNACNKGFLSEISYKNIICLHATSFVIVLPYLFAFLNKSYDSKIRAVSESNSLFPLFQYGKCFHKFSSCLVISVPTMLKTLQSIVVESNYEYNELNLISCGEPLTSSLAKKLIELNPIKFFNLYGCTEVAPWIFYLDVINFMSNMAPMPILPVGSPLPYVDCKINSEGELLISSPSLFQGYLNHNNACLCEDKTGKVYFNTSDLFEIWESFYICKGRKNSVIKLSGTYVNPILIEAVLKNHYNDDSLIAIPDCENSTLKIHFFNNDNDDSIRINTDKSYIRNILKDQLSGSVVLSVIRHKEQPIRLSSGKIDRKYYFTNAN